jgi:hypothetical protein
VADFQPCYVPYYWGVATLGDSVSNGVLPPALLTFGRFGEANGNQPARIRDDVVDDSVPAYFNGVRNWAFM